MTMETSISHNKEIEDFVLWILDTGWHYSTRKKAWFKGNSTYYSFQELYIHYIHENKEKTTIIP